MLSDEDIGKIADAVVARLHQGLPAAPTDPLFSRAEAARYLHISLRDFDRKRGEHALALQPWAPGNPLRWAQSTLDAFRLGGGGAPPRRRRGRRPGSKWPKAPGSNGTRDK